MMENDAEAFWDELSLVEDWLGGGFTRNRPRPVSFVAGGQAETPFGRDDLPPMKAANVSMSRLAPAEVHSALERLRSEANACASCRLSAQRSKVVFGTGSESPLVLVVGEGPRCGGGRERPSLRGPGGPPPR